MRLFVNDATDVMTSEPEVKDLARELHFDFALLQLRSKYQSLSGVAGDDLDPQAFKCVSKVVVFRAIQRN